MDITDVRVTVGADYTLIFTHMSTKIVYTYKHYDVGLHLQSAKRSQKQKIRNKKVKKLSNSIKETIEAYFWKYCYVKVGTEFSSDFPGKSCRENFYEICYEFICYFEEVKRNINCTN